jgi:hypothetical protein
MVLETDIIIENVQTEKIATDTLHTPSSQCLCISELCYSEERRNDRLLCLRRNGQGVEVSIQDQVKVTITAVCFHQADHSMSNGK